MRAKLTLLSAFAVGIVGGALVSACQTYDFEPVEPLALAQTTVGEVIKARALKPNMMVLLDTSGSMTLPVNESDPDCKLSTGEICGTTTPCDPRVCPTRWTELQAAMSQFLDSSGTVARMGLTMYPGPREQAAVHCTASNSVRIPIPQVDDGDTAALQDSAAKIKAAILGIPNSGSGQPLGGTPTSLSLNFVGNLADLQTRDRPDFVLLLTDGLPNCNPQNPNNGITNPQACRCTLSSCSSASVATLVCLDKEASVTSVTSLQQKGIQTIVIGFGAETASGAGPETLNAMAEAGGFARSCAKDPNACGTDTCNPTTKLCSRRFYQAANQAELANALRDIINRVNDRDPCLLALDPAQRPSDDSLIVVYVNDEAVAPGPNTWNLTDLGVQFVGATCDRILSSTDANPIKVEARAVQRK